MTDFFPNSRSAGNCSDRGTSVSPKTKWKMSVCGSSFASARHWVAWRRAKPPERSSETSASGCSA